MSKKIEERVNRSFTNATPDISQSVIADCQSRNVSRPVPAKRSTISFWKVATLALALILVVTGIFGGVELGATAQAAVVALDVNPSIELKVDGRNRIIQATANNDDAQIILQSMDLKGSKLDVAVYAIIGSMVTHGYLSEYTNSVLVSVDTKKQDLYNEIIDVVTSKIEVTLKEKNIEASVVAQWIKDKEEIASIANEYNISTGKATLITKIIDASSKDTSVNATVYTVEDLVNRTVNELAIIFAKYAGDKVDEIVTNGSASEKAYIGKDQALAIALEEFGLSSNMDTGLDLHTKVDLDIENGVMVYEVEFVYGDYKYEIDIKAVNGEIIKMEKKALSLRDNPPDTELTDDQLIEIATQGIENVTNVTIERDGKRVEVLFQTEEHCYEVELTPSGKVVGMEKHNIVQGGTDILTEEKIEKIALEILSRQLHFLDGQIEEIDCELSADGTYYEVCIEVFGMEFDLRINAVTGEPMRFGMGNHGFGDGTPGELPGGTDGDHHGGRD